MNFCTAINCMDGRVQLPVNRYLRQRFGVEYVDTITEAGPNLILGQRQDPALVQGILKRVTISIERHGSIGISVLGHADCAGNPAPYLDQLDQIRSSVQFLRSQFPGLPVIGLWVDRSWQVHEVVAQDDETL
jgi:hypothetical protein